MNERKGGRSCKGVGRRSTRDGDTFSRHGKYLLCLVKVSHQLTRLIASLFLQLKGDCPEDSDIEGALPSFSSREERRARFRSFLSFLAQFSDVEVKTKKLFSAARVIHLTSEDAPESEESIALTTTSALLQMFEAWWLEFKQKDGHSGSLQTKLR